MNRHYATVAAIAVLASAVLSPTLALAQAAIEEVTVTATRREETQQSVPISVTALSASDLAAVHITEPQELSEASPGLQILQQSGGLSPFVRGVGSLDVSAGQENSVSVYIDGVFLPAAYGNVFSFNNIERVEVLKGPQGTLFGRNAAGGLVQIITKTPNGDTNAYGAVSFGNYQTTQANLYATTGFGEQLAGDVAAVFLDQKQGYGINVTTGHEFDRPRETLLRSKWVYKPLETTRVTAWGSFVNSMRQAGAGKQFLPGVRGLDGVTTYTGHWHDITGNIDPRIDAHGYIGAVQVDQQFGFADFKSISAYQRLHVKQPFDNDLTPLPIIDVDINEQSYKTLTQELQLLSKPTSAIKWIVGAFFMKDQAGFLGPTGLGLFGAAFGGAGVAIHNSVRTTSYAGFGEVTVPIVTDTNLTIGARYTRDKRELSGHTDVLVSSANRTVLATIPVSPTRDKSFSEPTYRAIVDHKFTDRVMIYGSYSRGFKSGNFNAVAATDPPFRPEIVDAYEIGAKSELFGRRLRLNGAVFYNNYKDIQLGVSNGPTITTINATSADIKGGEIEANAVVTDFLRMGVGFSYLNTKVSSFPNAICLIPQPVGDLQTTCNASGNELPRAPKYTVNVNPVVTLPLPNGKLRAAITYYHNDGFFWDYSNIRRQSSYDVLDGSVGWTSRDDRLGVRVWANNITDEHYAIFLVQQIPGDDFAAAAPRTYGIELSYSFAPR